ncbi:hypothetical protein [Nocardia brasiliensis]|uniref:hypothetical protein n=1 Tax=Nocardia brasiliensis TaxID=37326 RepID=UPI0036727796
MLKQALRSCVPIQVAQSEPAREKYLDFVAKRIQSGSSVNPRQIAALLISPSPNDELLDAYIEALTGSSLQSQTQVTASLAALGLSEQRQLFVESKDLNSLFKARNEIAHEMDMTTAAVKGRGDRTRRERSLSAYIDMCHGGLNYCQRVLNQLEKSLQS